jgi:hypothetical protein
VIHLELTPTPTSSSATTAEPTTTPTAIPTASTSTPSSVPANTPENQPKDDGSAVATIALFAGVIGVALGWALREVTAFLKGKAEAKRQTEAAEQTRVLEFIHTGENLSAAANGLGTTYAALADGKTLDASQLLDLTNRYNEARIQISRLRLEIAILGPEWVGDRAMNIENAANVLQTALRAAEQEQDESSFAALISEIGTFRDKRSTLIKAAMARYQPGRATSEAAHAEQPPAPQEAL